MNVWVVSVLVHWPMVILLLGEGQRNHCTFYISGSLLIGIGPLFLLIDFRSAKWLSSGNWEKDGLLVGRLLLAF